VLKLQDDRNLAGTSDKHKVDTRQDQSPTLLKLQEDRNLADTSDEHKFDTRQHKSPAKQNLQEEDKTAQSLQQQDVTEKQSLFQMLWHRGVGKQRRQMEQTVQQPQQEQQQEQQKQQKQQEEQEQQHSDVEGDKAGILPGMQLVHMHQAKDDDLPSEGHQPEPMLKPPQQITVCARKRPMIESEVAMGQTDVVSVLSDGEVVMHKEKTSLYLTNYVDNLHFRYDYAFDERHKNAVVYKYTAKPMVENIFKGGISTCFAYGHVASGKTHIMVGTRGRRYKNGLCAMTAEDIFVYLKSPEYKHLDLTVYASFFEVHCGEIFDLLNNKSQMIFREDHRKRVVIRGLTEKAVHSIRDVLQIIQRGNAVRTCWETPDNKNSARSHAIFQFVLRKAGRTIIHGKFSLVDLVGNETGDNTSCANQKTRNERAEANTSLLAVKECIRALAADSDRIPYRNSKLTRVLRDSFIRNSSMICVIAMVSPAAIAYKSTLHTLTTAEYMVHPQ
jgi:kinesin family protein 2/24